MKNCYSNKINRATCPFYTGFSKKTEGLGIRNSKIYAISAAENG
jgi:hypothetical protein